MALDSVLIEVLGELELSRELRWSALRAKSEDRFRDELAKALDARTADEVFVAPSVAAGGSRRADIAEIRDGAILSTIEMKQVWGADPNWGRDGSTKDAREAFPNIDPPLHALVLWEAGRARAAGSEQGIVLLQVVHIETPTTPSFRKSRGLASQAVATRDVAAVDQQLLMFLQSAGEEHGPFVVLEHELDARTGIRFSIHVMFAVVT